jgi:ABC-type sugar transport system substrate-binding protein
MEELLHRCPDLEAVFACNDPMAAGALQAARAWAANARRIWPLLVMTMCPKRPTTPPR